MKNLEYVNKIHYFLEHLLVILQRIKEILEEVFSISIIIITSQTNVCKSVTFFIPVVTSRNLLGFVVKSS
jgi:hypothetical protein